MNSMTKYFMVGDNCDHCRYLRHAFILIRLPLHNLTIDDVKNRSSELAGAFVFACPALETRHAKTLYEIVNNQDSQLVSFCESAPGHKSLINPPRFLASEFSNTELKNALISTRDHKDQPDTINIQHPALQALRGSSKAVRGIRSLINQVALTDSTVLILGHSGTGKDIVASAIHALSSRKNNSFVPINCGAIPGELMESELFGHEKGSFTGASMRRLGRFELANKGTLFLDEIGDMPMPMQVKLLRVLQERKIQRVGGNDSIKVDVRIIAATNKNLEKLIQEHGFREDLFYRLNVFPIQVPSLKERAEDIPALIDHHLEKIQQRLNHKVIFTDAAIEALCKYPWPGNIRELENFLERMVVIHQDSVLDVKDLDPQYKNRKKMPMPDSSALFAQHDETGFDITEYISGVERQAIELALRHSNGLVEAAAKYLSMAPKKLLEKMKKYQLKTEPEGAG